MEAAQPAALKTSQYGDFIVVQGRYRQEGNSLYDNPEADLKWWVSSSSFPGWVSVVATDQAHALQCVLDHALNLTKQKVSSQTVTKFEKAIEMAAEAVWKEF